MAAVRRNILTNAAARDAYIRGIKLLKQEFSGPRTTDFRIPGPAQPVSTYDLFTIWHHVAMNTFTPPAQMDRNAAHRGPVFLPWHRAMLIQLELNLQRVLRDPAFGLPYWDWAADGDRPAAQQPASAIWGAQCMGGAGSPVTSGPFAFNAASQTAWRIRIEVDPNGNLRSANRGLRRAFAQRPITGLPTRARVGEALAQTTYDAPPWGAATTTGFRHRLEGWVPAASAPGLHNRVHAWVGGDMLVSTSPNDPVFYLNHCNVDRIWAAWQTRPGTTYLPDQSAPVALQGHRIDDPMASLLSAPRTPREMLNVVQFYSYDSLVVS